MFIGVHKLHVAMYRKSVMNLPGIIQMGCAQTAALGAVVHCAGERAVLVPVPSTKPHYTNPHCTNPHRTSLYITVQILTAQILTAQILVRVPVPCIFSYKNSCKQI